MYPRLAPRKQRPALQFVNQWLAGGELDPQWKADPEFKKFAKKGGAKSGFLLNMSDMQTMRRILMEVGVLADDQVPTGEYCDRRLLARRSATPHAVPIYKFATNDHWIVTPDECKLIAIALRDRGARAVRKVVKPQGDWPAIVGAFAIFNAACADLGGYEVS